MRSDDDRTHPSRLLPAPRGGGPSEAEGEGWWRGANRTNPRLQRPREPARVQHCEAAEPLPGEFQLCAPRKPAVLSLVPGAVGEKLTLETSAMGGERTLRCRSVAGTRSPFRLQRCSRVVRTGRSSTSVFYVERKSRQEVLATVRAQRDGRLHLKLSAGGQRGRIPNRQGTPMQVFLLADQHGSESKNHNSDHKYNFNIIN
jgi:hypothetical protein